MALGFWIDCLSERAARDLRARDVPASQPGRDLRGHDGDGDVHPATNAGRELDPARHLSADGDIDGDGDPHDDAGCDRGSGLTP